MDSPSCLRRAAAQQQHQEVVAPVVVGGGEPFQPSGPHAVHYSTTTTVTDAVDAAELHPHLLLLPQAAPTAPPAPVVVGGEPFQPSGPQVVGGGEPFQPSGPHAVDYSTTATAITVTDVHLLLPQAAPTAPPAPVVVGGEPFQPSGPHAVHYSTTATVTTVTDAVDAAELHPHLLLLPQAAPTAPPGSTFQPGGQQMRDATTAFAFADLQLHAGGAYIWIMHIRLAISS